MVLVARQLAFLLPVSEGIASIIQSIHTCAMQLLLRVFSLRLRLTITACITEESPVGLLLHFKIVS